MSGVPALPVCEECGNSQVTRGLVEGLEVEVCELCGAVQGDGEEVRKARVRSEARDRGFQAEVYPLVLALESVPTFKVAAASAGRADRHEYPFVFLRVKEEGGLTDLERLLTSLEMANRATRRRWVLELTLQRGLLCILRPRFWKPVQEITSADILEARGDLPVLAEDIRRDVRLAWWRG